MQPLSGQADPQHASDIDASLKDGTFDSIFESWLNKNTSTRPKGVSEARRLRQASAHRFKRDRHKSQRRQQNLQSTFKIAQSLSTLDVWPRGRDIETWNFCAREFTSFVTSFATTGSSPFILHSVFEDRSKPHIQLHVSLQRALGVCAAHGTLGGSNQHFFTQLLDTEVQQLIESSKFGNVPVTYHSVLETQEDGLSDSLSAFRASLARLQSMTLYQIMGLFSNDAGRQRTAQHQEALMASWTRELLLQIQVLELQSKSSSLSFSISPINSSLGTAGPDEGQYEDPLESESLPDSLAFLQDNMPLQREEVMSAYRTIVISYLVRM
ncbi:hypothetical protein AK830_g1317 [Neonectria ditissima]|uniref:Uncharacterized protein n=1 Tax=Neonectria ditissima TaxID=78410 RepID=A0A0P7BES1_9HYPO|nr:hypothetical protein AK830_g1317 [Neonectria ditissima]